MYAEVDVFISNYTLVDADIFQLWTEGYSCKRNSVQRNHYFLCSAFTFNANLNFPQQPKQFIFKTQKVLQKICQHHWS